MTITKKNPLLIIKLATGFLLIYTPKLTKGPSKFQFLPFHKEEQQKTSQRTRMKTVKQVHALPFMFMFRNMFMNMFMFGKHDLSRNLKERICS